MQIKTMEMFAVHVAMMVSLVDRRTNVSIMCSCCLFSFTQCAFQGDTIKAPVSLSIPFSSLRMLMLRLTEAVEPCKAVDDPCKEAEEYRLDVGDAVPSPTPAEPFATEVPTPVSAGEAETLPAAKKLNEFHPGERKPSP